MQWLIARCEDWKGWVRLIDGSFMLLTKSHLWSSKRGAERWNRLLGICVVGGGGGADGEAGVGGGDPAWSGYDYDDITNSLITNFSFNDLFGVGEEIIILFAMHSTLSVIWALAIMLSRTKWCLMCTIQCMTRTPASLQDKNLSILTSANTTLEIFRPCSVIAMTWSVSPML